MPQETNLNVSPYFDDFDSNKNYYKVLFKPGYPVQARELTTLQSILQNQIETFGGYVFKEGSPVSGGNVNYNNNLPAVLLQSQFNGVDVGLYLSEIVGKVIKGESSGVRAKILSYISPILSVKDTYTIYVSFLDADSQTNSKQNFLDGEALIVDENVSPTYESNFSFQKGQKFANTISNSCNAIGSSINVSKGIYFFRGYFVRVSEQFLILDQYTNIPNYKIGFKLNENLVNSDIDPTLLDNSQGFSNYAAPGADRLNLTATLVALPLDAEDIQNFIQIAKVINGVYTSIINTPQLNDIEQEFAKRTYDESGDYYVTTPYITSEESLNNLLGNNGVFNKGQLTYNNNKPSEDLGCYKVSPFEAYVQGYNIKTISPTYIDFKKPRTTKTLSNQSINYLTGPSFVLNRVYGAPILGISTSYTLSLRDTRVGTSQTAAAGKEIGLSRVYDFSLSSGSYNISNLDANEWNISLYDIQPYTEISVNQSFSSLPIPTYIEGKASGASGFLRFDASNSGIITAYNTKGQFAPGEQLIINGIENTRIATAINSYSISDVKSVYGIVGSAYTFTADIKQSTAQQINQVTITPRSAGVSTVTSTNTVFSGIATVGNLVAFTNPGVSTNTYGIITSVSKNSLVISGITTVSGVCDGALPASQINPQDFRILRSSLASSTDNTLYTPLGKNNISSVDFTNSELTIKKEFDVTISNNSITVPPSSISSNQTFLPFNIERYVLIRNDGGTESLRSDQFVFTSGGTNLTINGLSVSSGTAKLIATLRQINVNAKVKNKNKVKTIIVDKSVYQGSGIGSTTLNDGLTYGNYPYGTRVQDKEICLLYPDVTKVYGVFESGQISTPSLPNLVFSSLTGPNNSTVDLLVGEKFAGSDSKALGIYVESVNNSSINFVSLNSNSFKVGEKITFEDSGVSAIISSFSTGDNNIISNFSFDNGQRNTLYDYSRLIRKSNVSSPSKKLRIVFEYVDFSPSDTGDVTVVNSYNQFDYCNIPTINGISNTDILDIRPRVSPYTVTQSATSPFEFSSRSFTAPGNSASSVLASNESILLSYSFYLPRIDKLFVDKNGLFQLSLGTPAENPQIPPPVKNALELATITLPAYLCNSSKSTIVFTDHKRYRMSDIKLLENRIQNLESYTTLSALENNTSNLRITDSNGISRPKCGFFVDDFTTTTSQRKTTIIKNSIDISNRELRPAPYTTLIDLIPGSYSLVGIGTSANPQADLKYVDDLIGSNIKRTGDVITLDYTEVQELSQPYSTEVVNINPYNVSYYSGSISLYPSSDIWIDQVQTAVPNTISVEGNYTATVNQLSAQGYDPQTGYGPTTWGSWETTWTGKSVSETTQQITSGNKIIEQVIDTTTETGTQTRTGSQQVIVQKLDTQNIGNTVVSTSIIPYMRSRNIEFTAQGLKPYTQLYAFFSGVDVNNYIIPKLLEVTMTSGVFQVGETVIGRARATGLVLPGQTYSPTYISFRVAKQNHKNGPYTNPTEVYATNPYIRDQVLSADYSSTSTILNIDTYSLSSQVQGDFYGNIEVGMILVGQTSGAQATISNIRLIPDQYGYLRGSFFIPNPNVISNPHFASGTQTLTLTNSSINTQIPGEVISSVNGNYYAQGTLETDQANILSIRNASVETQTVTQSQATSKTDDPVVVKSTVVGTVPQPSPSDGGGGGGSSGDKVYQGYAGGQDQNAGSSLAYAYNSGSATFGNGALERALADGYSRESIISWIDSSGAAVGQVAADKLGISCRGVGCG